MLTEKAMLVSLTIRAWGARRQDRRAEASVARDFAAAPGAGRYSKHLVAREVLLPVQRAEGALREQHARMTLPWATEGARILPAALWVRYSDEMRGLRAAYDAAVADLVLAYPAAVEAARAVLGALWRAEDYPPAGEIGARFSVAVDVLPVPDAGDWRVSLGAEEETRIRESISRQVREAETGATRSCWERVRELGERIIRVCGSDAPRVHASLAREIASLAELLPALNLTGDPLLAQQAEDLARGLGRLGLEELRSSPEVRAVAVARASDAVDVAAEVLADMGAMYGGAR